jgi:predicted nucleic acid-binding Zn ribbon protein
VCPVCGSDKVSQLLSAPAVQFKGTGWYVTDYGRAGSGGGSKPNNSAGGEAAKSEKSDTTGKTEATAAKDSKSSKTSSTGSSNEK